MKTKVTPRGSMCLVRPVTKEETLGGLVLPDTAKKERVNYGEVIAKGKEVHDIGKGDKVIFNPYAGEPVMLDDEENLVLIDEKDIYGTFE